MSTSDNENAGQLRPAQELEQLRQQIEAFTTREGEHARREAEYAQNQQRWEARVDRGINARRDVEKQIGHVPANAKEYLCILL